jgi:hypothetical protein
MNKAKLIFACLLMNYNNGSQAFLLRGTKTTLRLGHGTVTLKIYVWLEYYKFVAVIRTIESMRNALTLYDSGSQTFLARGTKNH